MTLKYWSKAKILTIVGELPRPNKGWSFQLHRDNAKSCIEYTLRLRFPPLAVTAIPSVMEHGYRSATTAKSKEHAYIPDLKDGELRTKMLKLDCQCGIVGILFFEVDD